MAAVNLVFLMMSGTSYLSWLRICRQALVNTPGPLLKAVREAGLSADWKQRAPYKDKARISSHRPGCRCSQ